jgi:hypothetical protein
MRMSLVVSAALGLAVAGCKLMEPRPDEGAGVGRSTLGGPVPAAPSIQSIPDTGAVPALPKSTEIIVGLCNATGTYSAAGVDTEARRFTFLIKGGRETQAAAFARFYEARVPVTVYTGAVALRNREQTPAPAPSTPPASLAPVPPPDSKGSTGGDALYDPCGNIGEEPPPTPKPGGSNWEPSQLTSFEHLAWDTAYALDAVSKPVGRASTVPVPR